MSLWLSQTEADALFSMEKLALTDNYYRLPDFGGGLSVPLTSEDGHEEFFLDIARGKINLSKGTFQNRGRRIIVLARLDFGGPPHRNPDGQEIGSPHLHLYREGYHDKWAFDVPRKIFSNLNDQWRSIHDFMTYCNIIKLPQLERGLFT